MISIARQIFQHYTLEEVSWWPIHKCNSGRVQQTQPSVQTMLKSMLQILRWWQDLILGIRLYQMQAMTGIVNIELVSIKLVRQILQLPMVERKDSWLFKLSSTALVEVLASLDRRMDCGLIMFPVNLVLLIPEFILMSHLDKSYSFLLIGMFLLTLNQLKVTQIKNLYLN